MPLVRCEVAFFPSEAHVAVAAETKLEEAEEPKAEEAEEAAIASGGPRQQHDRSVTGTAQGEGEGTRHDLAGDHVGEGGGRRYESDSQFWGAAHVHVRVANGWLQDLVVAAVYSSEVRSVTVCSGM